MRNDRITERRTTGEGRNGNRRKGRRGMERRIRKPQQKEYKEGMNKEKRIEKTEKRNIERNRKKEKRIKSKRQIIQKEEKKFTRQENDRRMTGEGMEERKIWKESRGKERINFRNIKYQKQNKDSFRFKQCFSSRYLFIFIMFLSIFLIM